jgi:hypothetical protein
MLTQVRPRKSRTTAVHSLGNANRYMGALCADRAPAIQRYTRGIIKQGLPASKFTLEHPAITKTVAYRITKCQSWQRPWELISLLLWQMSAWNLKRAMTCSMPLLQSHSKTPGSMDLTYNSWNETPSLFQLHHSRSSKIPVLYFDSAVFYLDSTSLILRWE